ncbi:urea carboxylase-associated family protein [Gammaproteobacteria bacterium LSUCC0112]|nr:urea carboxylase-associated family protein [Gammaproteobacteria bacterium LSUCC0112]
MKNQELFPSEYKTVIAPGAHWSLVVRKGIKMTLTDLEGGANVGMLFYNPNLLSEKYNAPDTLKCQHTFKLTRGHCLYSDMGRVFASITHDSFGWHDTICGNCHAQHVESRWGERSYQTQRNAWLQNGFDAFLVELAKYRMKKQDLASNLNLFSEVSVDDEGKLRLSRQSQAGDTITLRFEMDTLVVMHTCPHPLNTAADYPRKPVQVFLEKADPIQADDYCLNLCDENRRGFHNNALYHLGT